MKKVLLFAILPLLFACGNESKMKSEIKKYVDKNFNDPKSYEFVSIEIFDTVYSNELAKSEIEYINERIKDYKIKKSDAANELIKNDRLNKQFGTKDFDEFIIRAGADIDFYSKEIKNDSLEILNLNKYLNNAELIGYMATHKCRANNKLGAKILDSFTVFFDNNFNLIKHDATYQNAIELLENRNKQ